MDLSSFLNRTRGIIESKSVKHGFRKYLSGLGNELPPDEYVGHKNYLKVAAPLVKSLELFQRTQLNDQQRFTDEERKIIVAAIRQLKASLVPIALIKKGKDEEIILL